jgi:Cu(I)/Ag(I) efflux system membrane fusion protein
LLTLDSPELVQSEQEYLIELTADSTAIHGGGARGAGRRRLERLGVPDAEIQRLERERTASSRITIPSPATGTVLEKNVVAGQAVGPEQELFTIVDLSRVWVLADLYAMDLGQVRVGDRARFTSDALPGETLEARVEFLYPTISSETRPLKARLSLANPGGRLKPGMFGRVFILGRATPLLSVPSEAVVHTGDHDYVFLAHADGHFEPRLVTVGRRGDERMQILRGLAEGDTVVASGSFLIDSESRLKAAIAGSTPAAGATGHEGHAP